MTEEEKRQHRCCFTGHRPEKLDQPEDVVKAWLNKEIDNAIAQGFSTFVSGMAMGVDLWAAEIVLEKKKTDSTIHLIAAAPFPTFSIRWSEEWRAKYKDVWDAADYRISVSDSYSDDVFQRRNVWMVDRCSLVIACYNGAPGGTRNTIEYAKSKCVHVVVSIDDSTPPVQYPQSLLSRLSPNDTWPNDIETRLTVAFFSLQSIRDIEAIEKRYKDGKTLQAIGDEMGITRERVRQLIERSEKRLKGELPFLRAEQTDDEKLLKKEWLVGRLIK